MVKEYVAHHSTAAVHYHNFKLGDRVWTSDLARERGIFKMAHSLRSGTVTGKVDQYRSTVMVRWDGNKSISRIFHGYVVLIPEVEVSDGNELDRL